MRGGRESWRVRHQLNILCVVRKVESRRPCDTLYHLARERVCYDDGKRNERNVNRTVSPCGGCRDVFRFCFLAARPFCARVYESNRTVASRLTLARRKGHVTAVSDERVEKIRIDNDLYYTSAHAFSLNNVYTPHGRDGGGRSGSVGGGRFYRSGGGGSSTRLRGVSTNYC